MFGLQRAVQHIAFVGLGQGSGRVYRNLEKRRQGCWAFCDKVGDGAAGRVHQ
ncbi:hypothetical protein D3C85_1827530 [compost metagenome]